MPQEGINKSNEKSEKSAHHSAPAVYGHCSHIEELFSSGSEHFLDGDYSKSDCLFYEADARAECESSQVPPALRIKIKAKRAHLYELMQESAKAIGCYEAGIKLADDNGLRVSQTAAIMHNNLASLKKERQQWLKVEYHYKMSLLIFELLDGGFNPKVATLYHNIGCCHARSQNYKMAIRLFKRAYKIRRVCFGKDELHPDTKRTKMHLAATLLADGQRKESKKFFAHFSTKEVDDFMERIASGYRRQLN